MRIICAPSTFDFVSQPHDLGVTLYGKAKPGQGSAGEALVGDVRRALLSPSQEAWDFLSFALAVITADLAVHRSASPDGWTRRIDLAVAVKDPAFWNTQAPRLVALLRHLTTDIWTVRFLPGGVTPDPHRRHIYPPEDCVSLFSGGLDSFIGALDLAAVARRPMVVSQVVRGDAAKQVAFPKIIGGGLRSLALNHNADAPGAPIVSSQRSRSIAFLAYGVLAASSLAKHKGGDTVELFVCENGFISINPPLTPLRLGSLSTRTSHPIVLDLLQEVLDAGEMRVRIVCPYQHKTKGEMLLECRNQNLLRTMAHETTSCGRFQHFGYKHCGRCLPCLVRRASFLKWAVDDKTKYVHGKLSRKDSQHSGFDDVRAATMAVLQVEEESLDSWLGATLSAPQLKSVGELRAVVERGLAELAQFLRSQGVT